MATIYVPLLTPIFKTEPLTAAELAFTFAMSSVVFVAVEIEKLVMRRQDRRKRRRRLSRCDEAAGKKIAARGREVPCGVSRVQWH
ncbi:MAG: hypothetical protein EHM37_09125 [Deltaproteobacteria bacterium]|nr:MAG: hypothetical protein EHM37_09125 [Deltaproteobacteria bacterium]